MKQITNPLSRKNKASHQPIIGLLGDELLFDIPKRIFKTIKKMALDANIIVYYITARLYSEKNENVNIDKLVYDFISNRNMDGLIIMSNLLSSSIPIDEFMNLCQSISIPLVSLGEKIKNAVSILADNEIGVYKAVKHLIDVHNYKHIGFLKGPSDHLEAQARFQGYFRAINEYDIPLNQNIIVQGDFTPYSGKAALENLLDHRGIIPGKDINALVCANDYMAATVLIDLLERGYRIPEDIALVGFDNIPMSRSLMPSLSTVNHNFEEMSAHAFNLLQKMMKGETVPLTVSVSTEFIPRSSCGCTKSKTEISRALIKKNLKMIDDYTPEKINKSLNKTIFFLNDNEQSIWNDIIITIQNNTSVYKTTPQKNEIPDPAKLNYLLMYNTLNKVVNNLNSGRVVNTLGRDLSSTFNLEVLKQTVVKKLPLLGINRCCLNLFDNSGNSHEGRLPKYSYLILAFQNKQGQVLKETLPSKGLRFSTKNMIPEPISKKYGPMNWIIFTLYYNEEKIGFILLNDNAEDMTLYYDIRFHLSSRIKSALLLKDYEDRSRKLAIANAKIQNFAKQLEDENLRIKTEMHIARSIQESLLPKNYKHIHPDFEIISFTIPATEVGGDFFDIMIDDQKNLWLGIGDVSGHGLDAGMIVTIAQSAQTTIISNPDNTPKDVIKTMNKVLRNIVSNRLEQDKYMTCSILKYLNQGRFLYSGMHLNYLLFNPLQQSCQEIPHQGIWLNVIDDIDFCTLNQEFIMEVGEILVLYTDGITEIKSKKGQLLDLQGLKKIILKYNNHNLDEMLKNIKTEVMNYNDNEHYDDMTLVLLRRLK